MKPLEAIRCTQQSCPCECFAPGKVCLRYCDSCSHGWVAHALDKLGYQHAYNLGMQVEVVQPNIVFDIASLMLYGSQATPVRLKILLDRLFSVLQHEEVLQVLHGFGWSYEDYARGYILQDNGGRVLDKWSMATRDEEHVILQQFLRFGETKAIAQEIILQDTRDKQEAYSKQTTRAESEIKKFIERSNLTMQSFIKMDPARQMFASRLPYVPSARPLLTSPILAPSPYSPSSRDSAARPLSLTTSPASASTPLPTAPISRLQAYEFRRELVSPAPSPIATDNKVGLTATTSSVMSVVPTVVSSLAAGRRSPVMEGPRNLSTTPSSVQSAPSPCVTPQKPLALESGGELSAGYSGDSDDDQSVGAIDYSTRDSDSPHDLDRKAAAARHLRKSNNPIKRQWIPSANFGSTFIGPNGKKRVLCTACNKTFCDKGALKIHYSAVHLKEMHKCTVEGCNMMFSSRRSRNRHSANPNPKLHMPQKRKELEGMDDDGKVMNSLSTTLSTSLSSSPSMVVTPALVAAHRSLEAGGLLRADPAYFMELGAQFPFASPPDKRIKLESQDAPTDLSSSAADKGKGVNEEKGEQTTTADSLLSPTDKAKDNEQAEGEADNNDVTGEGGGEEGSKGDTGAHRGGNRRKCNVPTRCAQKEEPMVLSDDNSDDRETGSKGSAPRNAHSQRAGREGDQQKAGVVSAEADHAKGEEQSDSLQESAAASENCPVRSAGEGEKKGSGAQNFPQIASLLLASKEQRDGDDDSSENELVINGDIDDEDDDDDDDEENDKDFGDKTSANDDNDHNHNTLSREEGRGEDGESCGSVSSSSSDTADGEAVFDAGGEGYFCKDNPRKCALCGKLFQNQFSVKIHFQNVHLKLMHGCTVDGCTAAFPSKRSRDRHSSNLNLHRKLMSGAESGLHSSSDPTLREDILSTLYGATQLTSSLVLHCSNQEGGADAARGSTESAPESSAQASEDPTSADQPAADEASDAEETSAEGEYLAENEESPMSSNGRRKEDGQAQYYKEATASSKDVKEKDDDKANGTASDLVAMRREEPVCMSRKPVCCGMTFHTESALKEHYDLSHPTQAIKSGHVAATETLLSSRRPRHRPRHKNGMHRLVSTGRKNGFS